MHISLLFALQIEFNVPSYWNVGARNDVAVSLARGGGAGVRARSAIPVHFLFRTCISIDIARRRSLDTFIFKSTFFENSFVGLVFLVHFLV